MRLIGYLEDGVRHIGSVTGDEMVPLGTASAFYADPQAAMARPGGQPVPLTNVSVEPAVPESARIFCAGVNYRSHADEAKSIVDFDKPERPVVFGRWAQSLTVDGTAIPIPPNEDGLDWEVELAVVIGRKGWNVQTADAFDLLLGYTGFNDITARRKQLETPQWTVGKNADLSGPIGPVLVTADELPDPTNLRVTTHVNGTVMQDANTKDLIHTIPELVAYISDTITLLPGDVIATGTPAGVGIGRKPPVLLTDGDEVVVEVERIGQIRNTVVART